MKTRATYAVLASIVVMACSCSTYRKFEAPEPDVHFTDTIPGVAWRDILKDTCLQRLIDTALVYNADCRTALLRVQEAEKSLVAARLAYLPGVNASPGLTYNSENAVQPVYSLGIDASWELDVFGKVTSKKRMAAASLDEMKALEQAVRTKVISTVANGYYELLTLDRKLEISQKTIVNWDKSIRVLEAMKLAGRSNDIAVLQAKAKMMNLQASTAALEGQIMCANQALCTLVGISHRPVERSKMGEWDIPSIEQDIPIDCIAARPDVHAAQKRLAQAYYAASVASADFFPSIRLSGGAAWTNFSGGKVFDPMQLVVNAAASLLEPIFARGQIITNLEIARLRQEEAMVAYRQAVLGAANEINDALNKTSTASKKVKVDREQQAALSTAVSKITLLMRYSTASYLEVLTAQESLLNSQLLLVQDELSEIQGRIALYAALGGDYRL